MSDERILSARSARTLYNVADALVPPGEGTPGGGDVDLAPFVARRLRAEGPGAARRLWLLLASIEWLPVLRLRARRGFSKLSLERREAELAGWRHSRLRWRREALGGLEAWVREGLEDHSREHAQATDPRDQSLPGA